MNVPGSGKFGTLCARMQRENASPAVDPLEAPVLALLGLLEPPHAASASVQLNAASAISRHRRR